MEKHFPNCAAMWILPDMSIVSTNNFPQIEHSKNTINSYN